MDCLYIDISKWLAFRVYSDKDVKIVGTSNPPLPILSDCCNLSTSCNKLVNFMNVQQVCLNQACYNLSFADLLQLAASLWITSFDTQLASCLLKTCSRLVNNKLSQVMRAHAAIGLLITRCQQICCNLRVLG